MARCVLVVDDDSDLLSLLKDTLKLVCDVESVVTASSLDQVKQKRDEVMKCGGLAILDVNLGYGQPSGVDVSQWLREVNFPGKIIFLTGHAKTDPKVIAAAQIPGTQILEKPITIDKLAAVVGHYLGPK